MFNTGARYEDISRQCTEHTHDLLAVSRRVHETLRYIYPAKTSKNYEWAC